MTDPTSYWCDIDGCGEIASVLIVSHPDDVAFCPGHDDPQREDMPWDERFKLDRAGRLPQRMGGLNRVQS